MVIKKQEGGQMNGKEILPEEQELKTAKVKSRVRARESERSCDFESDETLNKIHLFPIKATFDCSPCFHWAVCIQT